METVEDGVYEVSLGYVAERGDEMGLRGSKIHFAEMCGRGETGCWQFFLKNFVLMFQEEPATSLLTWRRTVEKGQQKRDCED